MDGAPRAERPRLPEDYGAPRGPEGLLPWSWAAARLEAARNYWFSTTRPDGRPHAVPAWAVWLDGQLFFEGSPATRRARNLAVQPALVVHLESGDEVVIVEGEAHPASPPPRPLAERLAAAFAAKYAVSHGYRPQPEQWDAGGLWALRPRVAYGWTAGWTAFPQTVTRWRFA